MHESITTSIFDIFKIGPGPSSSHTIGPMKAALSFRNFIAASLPVTGLVNATVDVFLYGSLSLTGEGHGTHKAVLGGLMGWTPETCCCQQLLALLEDPETIYELAFGETNSPFTAANIHFEGTDPSLPFANTLRFTLAIDGQIICEKEYYSTGGGFIKSRGEPEPAIPEPPYPYHDMRGLRQILRRTGLPLRDIMIRNETAISGISGDEIRERIDGLIAVMIHAVENGLEADGLLPGPIGLMRKARVLKTNSNRLKHEATRFLACLNAYALAASEENAAGQKVVTAPTSGASGVLPGIIYLLKNHFDLTTEQFRDGMLAAAAIAFIARHNASISGAEVGCQGEVGVASAMAAAFMTQAEGLSMRQVENAAEIALEHSLGMTCDPVLGYVQIPCIERNAMGAVNALNAHILSAVGDPARQKVTFDEVVEAMKETGMDMCKKYKETAQGGLALSCVSC